MRQRSELIDLVKSGKTPQIVIIGGGINGVGVFRDLAAQGVPSLLVETGDFSSGTSAAPSRLIHGGLRYLETGEAALVRESLVERNLLLKNARHIVHPQPVWIPLKSWFGGTAATVARFLRLTKTPGKKGAVPVAIGLRIYDLFGRTHQTMPNHRMISAKTARREMPALAPDVGLVAEYYDARISHPERLVMELVSDAENDCPDAMAIPYLAAGRQDNGALSLHDRLSDETFTVTPKVVINATGAWVDKVQADLGFSGRLMGGTRGTHLVMRNAKLSEDLGGRMLYFETHDFRACLALPLDDTHVYVGTTDIRTDDPDDIRYTEAEVDYILDVLKPALPGVDWKREDIVFIMAGIRPLPFQDDKVSAAGAISRDHRIDHFPAAQDRPFETFTLVGGKWTTYRAFAEQAADQILAHIGEQRRVKTDSLEIGGAHGLPETSALRSQWADKLAQDTGLAPERCAVLMQRYGAKAQDVARAESADSRTFETLDGYSPAEFSLICRTERVSRLGDIVLRRTLLGFEGHTSRAKLEEIAMIVADSLGWDVARQNAELAELVSYLETQHCVNVS